MASVWFHRRLAFSWLRRSRHALRKAPILILVAAAGFAPVSVESSVVRILVIQGSTISSGSGFVIASGGYVVTSAHVVQGRKAGDETRISVFPEGTSGAGYSAREIWLSRELDLAVLKADRLDQLPLPLNVGALSKDEAITAVGYPSAADAIDKGANALFVSTRTVGTIGRLIEADWQKTNRNVAVIQHSALIGPGSSGGPLTNACGQVVGINISYAMSRGGVRNHLPAEVSSPDDPHKAYFAVRSTEIAAAFTENRIPFSSTSQQCSPFRWSWDWMMITILSSIMSTALVFVYMRRRALRSAGRMINEPPHKTSEKPNAISLREPILERGAESMPKKKNATGNPEPMARFYLVPDSESRKATALLIVTDWALKADGIIVGREDGITRISIASSTISRDHARLRLKVGRDARLSVTDLGSTNGTFVNGTRLPSHSAVDIKSGDLVRFGSEQYRVAKNVRATERRPHNSTRDNLIFLHGRHPETGVPILIPLDRKQIAGRGSLLIGRNEEVCDFTISHATVSRKGHARIFLHDDGLAVSDAGTTSGIIVDGQTLRGKAFALLREQSVIQLGAVRLTVEKSQKTGPKSR